MAEILVVASLSGSWCCACLLTVTLSDTVISKTCVFPTMTNQNVYCQEIRHVSIVIVTMLIYSI